MWAAEKPITPKLIPDKGAAFGEPVRFRQSIFSGSGAWAARQFHKLEAAGPSPALGINTPVVPLAEMLTYIVGGYSGISRDGVTPALEAGGGQFNSGIPDCGRNRSGRGSLL